MIFVGGVAVNVVAQGALYGVSLNDRGSNTNHL